MNLETLSVLVFLGILAVIVYLDRKNIEFKYGLMIRRTKKGKNLIYKFAKKHKRKLQILGNIAVIVAIAASVYGFLMLFNMSYNIFLKPEEVKQSIALVLPTVAGIELPGFIMGVPFWYWIIGVFLVLMAHEPMHALLARAENIKIKSFGLLLLIVLPGAFVDPDEKQIKKLSILKKLRIYAAGSFGNFILGALLILILLFVLYPVFFRGSVLYGYMNYTDANRSEPFPAESTNLTGAILAIDNIQIENVEDLQAVMENKKPNQNILIETTEGKYNLTLTKNPENETKGYMGVFVVDYKVLKDEYRNDPNASIILLLFRDVFGWIILLNVGIGVANLFPIKPLDGGLIFEEIIKYFYRRKNVDLIVNGVSIFTLSLLLITLFGPSFIAWIG